MNIRWLNMKDAPLRSKKFIHLHHSAFKWSSTASAWCKKHGICAVLQVVARFHSYTGCLRGPSITYQCTPGLWHVLMSGNTLRCNVHTVGSFWQLPQQRCGQ